MKEWLTTKELMQEVDYDRKHLGSLVQQGVIPAEKTRIEGRKRLFHNSVVEALKQRKKEWEIKQAGIENEDEDDKPPDGLMKYDGFELTKEFIENLEAVRRQNGYRAIHWTNKTIAELIAEGGDAEEWKF